MHNFLSYFTIILAVALASLADSVSTLWAQGSSKFSVYLLLIFLLGPVVFIAFGLVTARVGLAITSGVVNSLLVLSSMCIGLFLFGEWSRLSVMQYVGMAFAIVGIILMLFFPKSGL